MRRYLAKALATLLVAFSASALAMGLGDIRLNSYLNQRLDAEIELVSAAADEVDTLVVELADREAYERIGLERPAVLSSLKFEVVRRPNGTAYIKVTSKEPIREPFLTFLVEADWSRGRLLREYTLLLDPPTFADRQQPAEAQSPAAATGAAAVAGAMADTVTETDVIPEDTGVSKPEPMQEAVAEPAVEPAGDTSMAAVAGVDEAEEPVQEDPYSEEQVSIPPLEADRAPQPSYRRAPAISGSYGPIQRNETLWSIASRMRPDESVTMNQMMVAIYRANPEAFAGNMNRMKQGYILRIPDFTEVSDISRSEAFRSAKQMNEEWDMSRGRVASDDFRVEPEVDDSLSLVAPEEDVEPEVGTGVGAGGEAEDIGAPGDAEVTLDDDDIDSAAVDLVGDESETSDRLIDIEDESMQAIQSGAGDDLVLEEGPTDDAIPTEEGIGDGAEPLSDLPPLPAEGEEIAPVGSEDGAVDAGDDMLAEDDSMTDGSGADADDSAAAAADADATAGDEAATAEPEPDRSSVVTTSRPQEKSLVDQAIEFATSTLGMMIGGGLLILVLVLVMLMQRGRRQAKEQAASAMADWMADETSEDDEVTQVAVGDDDATVIAGGSEDTTEGGMDTVFGQADEMEGSGTEAISGDDDASTQMISEADSGGHEDTMIGGETVTLDQNDPLSEADFNMAYGLYDQAAEVVQAAAAREPERADLHAKLCEIHFAANNKDEFMTAARNLKEIVGADGAEWSDVAIMGQQIAPNDDLFAGGGGTSAGVDLDFGEDDSATDDAPDFEKTMTGTPSPAAEEPASTPAEDAGGDLDFDLDLDAAIGGDDDSSSEPALADDSSTDDGADLDFDLGLDTGLGDETSSDDSDDDAGGDIDLGDLDLGDSDASSEPAAASSDDSDDTQTEFDKALSELSAYVDTNLPEGGAGDEIESGGSGGDDLNLDEFDFDKSSAGDELGSDEELGSGGDDDDDEGLGEIGTKLDLARAYVDMGDPDGARSILEEVLEDGDEQQKQEAQDLLDKL